MSIVAPLPVSIMAKYEFSEGEKQQLGQELAAKIARLQDLEAEKKSLMSELKERLDNAEGEVRRISNNINLGYEYRSYTCRIEKNYTLKIKEYYCVHTAKLIDTKKFEPHDFQQTFADIPADEKEDKKQKTKSGKDIDPSIGQGVDILATKEEKKRAVGKAFDKEATKILKKAGIKKNGQPSKAKK